jgi:hypothetical protein
MTTVNYKVFRHVAIAALMAVGIVTTIATGGSGSGGLTPTPTPVAKSRPP